MNSDRSATPSLASSARSSCSMSCWISTRFSVKISRTVCLASERCSTPSTTGSISSCPMFAGSRLAMSPTRSRSMRVAHGDRHADRQALDGLVRRRPFGAGAGRRLVDLIAQRKPPQLLQQRQHHRRPLARRPRRSPVRRLMRTPTSPGATTRTGGRSTSSSADPIIAPTASRRRPRGLPKVSSIPRTTAAHRGAHEHVNLRYDLLAALLDGIHVSLLLRAVRRR